MYVGAHATNVIDTVHIADGDAAYEQLIDLGVLLDEANVSEEGRNCIAPPRSSSPTNMTEREDAAAGDDAAPAGGARAWCGQTVDRDREEDRRDRTRSARQRYRRFRARGEDGGSEGCRAKARGVLAKGLALFKPTDAAQCKQTAASVKVVGGGAHDHGHSHGAAKAPPAKEKAAHSGFHAEYTFTCAKVEALQALETDYFKSFPSAQSLEVSLIGPKGQSKQTVTREKPRIDLKVAG